MGAKTLLTVEHLERLPETCDVSYELDQGELVEVSSASYLHNRIRDRLLHRLMNYLDTHPRTRASKCRRAMVPSEVRTLFALPTLR